jgi:hypothetical protein
MDALVEVMIQPSRRRCVGPRAERPPEPVRAVVPCSTTRRSVRVES